MEVHLVADTNLFFECKSLEQLPWRDLGYDPVVILLTRPVLDEIDKHKKASGRTRARALEIFGRVRGMLESSSEEVEIQPSCPKVVLRRTPNVRPDPTLREDLDYGKTDDRLIGIVSALNAQASGHKVILFTDDTGPASTADGLGVPYRMVNESWRRPRSETTEDKKIKELEKDLETYRAQEPKISISAGEAADEATFVEVTRKSAVPLTDGEVEGFMKALRLKHPLKKDFEPPPSSSTTYLDGHVVTIKYTSPTESDIANYRDELYPQWIGQCRKILENLHEGRDEAEPPVVLRWLISNKGTRPASQVRVELEAKGPLKLRRLGVEIADEEDTEIENASSQQVAVSRLPSAPKPPPFQKQITSIPLPSNLNPTRGIDIVPPKTLDLLSEHYKSFQHISEGLNLKHISQFDEHFKKLNAFTDVTKSMLTQFSVFNTPGLNTLFNEPSFADILHSSFEPYEFPRLHAPEPHDPEKFYYEWSAAEPVKNGALTCDLWRHQTGEQVVECGVVFIQDGEARGTVECTVHAENLTRPVQARLIVSRTIYFLNMTDIASALVEACQ